jgi:hypothetical protein
MKSGQRLALGFGIGGAITLLIHPASRGLMTYSLRPDSATQVIASSAFCKEPLELFPPAGDGATTLSDGYLTAFRIARRLNGLTGASERDLRVAASFTDYMGAREPDNAYWSQIGATLAHKGGDAEGAKQRWTFATHKSRWESGEAQQVTKLWGELASADGLRLAWQGLIAISFRTNDPAKFIAREAKRMTHQDLRHRFETLVNCGIMLRNTTTFALGNHARSLAEFAIYNGPKPRDLRVAASLQAAFTDQLGATLGVQASKRAQSELREIESWEALAYSSQAIAEATRQRLAIESVMTSMLPSSCLLVALAFTALWLLGRGLSAASRHGAQPGRLVALLSGLALGIFIYWQASSLLAGVWCLLLGAFAGTRVSFARIEDGPLPKFAACFGWATGLASMLLASAWMLARSAPSHHLIHNEWFINPLSFGWASALVLSLVIPFAALFGRANRRPILHFSGQILSSAAGFAAGVSLLLAIVSTPICILRESQNRVFVERWITNEPDTFRITAQ